MSDYISKSVLIENIKAEIQCVEKEKQQYFESGNFHNGNILVEKIQAMKLVMKIVANQPTIDEKEIIRKTVERIVERLEERKETHEKAGNLLWNRKDREGSLANNFQSIALEKAIEICKEEGGLNE